MSYENKLAKLFAHTCGGDNGYVKYVGDVAYRPLRDGTTIRGEIVAVDGHPALMLTAITKHHGEIDSITIPLYYPNQILDWYDGMSDEEMLNVAAQIDNYIDAFRY